MPRKATVHEIQRRREVQRIATGETRRQRLHRLQGLAEALRRVTRIRIDVAQTRDAFVRTHAHHDAILPGLGVMGVTENSLQGNPQRMDIDTGDSHWTRGLLPGSKPGTNCFALHAAASY